MNMTNRWSVLVLLAALAPLANTSADEVRVASRNDLIQALRQATAGTTILIEPGEYRGGISQPNLQGTPENPIIVCAADPARPPVIVGSGSGMHFSSPQHLELRDLVLAGASGNGLNIDNGGSAETPARHVTLRKLVVRDVGPTGNCDGIKLSGIDDFHVEHCRVQQWGSGGSAIDMVGCHRGLIRACLFHNARGDGANGVQAKGGSSDIVVQRCRFENAGGRGVNVGGSTGLQFFRPIDARYEAKTISVEDCEFLGGMAAVAFVGVDGAVVRHNTIYRPRRWAVRILQENTNPRFVACRNGQFTKNIVVFRSDEIGELINIGGQTAPETFEFAGNIWHCLDRDYATQRMVRLPVKEVGGSYGRDPGFQKPEQGDLHIPGRAPGDAGVRVPLELPAPSAHTLENPP